MADSESVLCSCCDGTDHPPVKMAERTDDVVEIKARRHGREHVVTLDLRPASAAS